MKKVLFLGLVLGIVTQFVLAQTVLFSEDFETGTASSDWELYRAGEEAIQAVPMSAAPATLDDGGSYVGYLQDIDASYSGAAIALAGDVNSQNYTIEADVYCYVNHSQGSAYTGVVVYGDSSHQGSASHGFYYKLVADFDNDHRFRLYNNQLAGFSYTFHQAIDATGLYTTDAWHHMKLKVESLDNNTTQFTCYFDESLLGAGAYVDDGSDRVGNGKWGLYSFQMDGTDGIAGYYDNVVVTENVTSGIDPILQLTPSSFVLGQNYPNPFNAATTISFEVKMTTPVTLDIRTLTGQFIRTLYRGNLEPSEYQLRWDGKDAQGFSVPSGVYLYTLSNGERQLSKKMVLLK